MSMYDPQYSRRQRPLEQDPSVYSHSRTRTTSSNVMPNPHQFQQSALPMHLAQPPQGHQRRTPSVNTFSTISSSGMVPPAAYRTSPTTNADIRRSTSSRSAGGGSITASSYVTLLRKQKATVWCDRAQYEDPRMIAQQRAAKMRATKEVVGATAGGAASYGSGGRTSTGFSSNKVAAKIKHHGRPMVTDYSPENNYVGVGGVPLRLSATEVEGGDSEEEDAATQRLHHRRTGSSGRSSTNSGRRQLGYRTSGGLHPTGSSGSNQNRRYSPGDTPERTGSLVQQDVIDTRTSSIQDDAASGRAPTTGSGSSAERRDDVPDLGVVGKQAPNSAAHATVSREKSVKSADELRRRGSVDERTMTLTSGRLFIANPD